MAEPSERHVPFTMAFATDKPEDAQFLAERMQQILNAAPIAESLALAVIYNQDISSTHKEVRELAEKYLASVKAKE